MLSNYCCGTRKQLSQLEKKQLITVSDLLAEVHANARSNPLCHEFYEHMVYKRDVLWYLSRKVRNIFIDFDRLKSDRRISEGGTWPDEWFGVVKANPPDELCCPITLELFQDPVRTNLGTVYERTAIQGWLSRCGTDPLTGQDLKKSLHADAVMFERCARYKAAVFLPNDASETESVLRAILEEALSDPLNFAVRSIVG